MLETLSSAGPPKPFPRASQHVACRGSCRETVISAPPEIMPFSLETSSVVCLEAINVPDSMYRQNPTPKPLTEPPAAAHQQSPENPRLVVIRRASSHLFILECSWPLFADTPIAFCIPSGSLNSVSKPSNPNTSPTSLSASSQIRPPASRPPCLSRRSVSCHAHVSIPVPRE